MLKRMIKEQGYTIRQLANETGIPYSTLNDLANYKIQLDQCKVGTLKKIADFLHLSMDELYEKCNHEICITSTKYNTIGYVVTRNQHYYIDFTYQNEHVNLLINKVVKNTSHYIRTIALWKMEDYINEKELESIANDIFINEKG